MEIHRQHLPYHPRHQQVFDLHPRRGIAIIEGYLAGLAGFTLGIDDALAFLGVSGHGLFGDHVAACFHRAADILVVKAVPGGHDDHIWMAFLEHHIKLRIQVPFDNDALPARPFHAVVQAPEIIIAQANQLAGICILVNQRVGIHF